MMLVFMCIYFSENPTHRYIYIFVSVRFVYRFIYVEDTWGSSSMRCQTHNTMFTRTLTCVQ